MAGFLSPIPPLGLGAGAAEKAGFRGPIPALLIGAGAEIRAGYRGLVPVLDIGAGAEIKAGFVGPLPTIGMGGGEDVVGPPPTEVGGGGKPRRKRERQYLELPDGTVVEVDSREEAQRVLDLYYEAQGKQGAPQVKRFTLKPKAKKKAAKARKSPHKVVFSTAEPVRLTLPKPVDLIGLELRLKRKIRQRKDEEALLLLM